MLATFDPGNALAFAVAMFLMVLAVGVPAAIGEWRDAQAHAAYWREKKLVELHVLAATLKTQIEARRALEQATA